MDPQTPTELAAFELQKTRSHLIGNALKLWAADDEHPERLHGLRAVVGADIRDVFEFVAELMAAQVFPVAPDLRRYAFIVGAIEGLSYSDMAKALDCSTGYISRTMRDLNGGQGGKPDVVKTYEPKLQKALALFATVNNHMQVTPDQALQEAEPETGPSGVVLTPDTLADLPDAPARVIGGPGATTQPNQTDQPAPRLQTEEDM